MPPFVLQPSKQIRAVCAAAFCFAIALTFARGAEPEKIPMTPDRWTTLGGNLDFVEHMGQPSIELKAGDYKKGIPSGMASLKDFQFSNGTIEYDVSAESGMGAEFMFRAADKDNLEMFYLRPRPNCQASPDCVQYAPQTHGVLLWDVFPQYQAPAPLQNGQWNHVKLVVSGKRMNIFVNGVAQPTLKVGRLEGDTAQGGIMLGGPGFFANLTIQPDRWKDLHPILNPMRRRQTLAICVPGSYPPSQNCKKDRRLSMQICQTAPRNGFPLMRNAAG
jgi:hypothetical protein